MILKEEYVMGRVKSLVDRNAQTDTNIKSKLLLSLIEQWEFDYDMEKEYRPEILKKEKNSDEEEFTGVVLQHKELGSLNQIATTLMVAAVKEIKKGGHSDLTLLMEGAAMGIGDIIEINNIVERRLK